MNENEKKFGEVLKRRENDINAAVMGKYCIVRSSERDVIAGTVEAVDGDRVLLRDARRLWYWDGAASTAQLAMEGVKYPGNCKFTVTISSILLGKVVEIIPTTQKAEANIKEVPEWKR